MGPNRKFVPSKVNFDFVVFVFFIALAKKFSENMENNSYSAKIIEYCTQLRVLERKYEYESLIIDAQCSNSIFLKKFKRVRPHFCQKHLMSHIYGQFFKIFEKMDHSSHFVISLGSFFSPEIHTLRKKKQEMAQNISNLESRDNF